MIRHNARDAISLCIEVEGYLVEETILHFIVMNFIFLANLT